MEKIYTGKTKDVFKKPDGNLLFQFKDDVTGENGVVDPGANTVMGQIGGKGRMSLELSQYYFTILKNHGIPTHFISANPEGGTMEVKNADLPGNDKDSTGGLEFICRLKAYGSFLRRYQKHIKEELQNLPYLVEITLKDDERGDPLINDDAIQALGILTEKQLTQGKVFTRKAAEIIEGDLRKKNLQLVDIKFEFGLLNENQEKKMVMIDEVSADCMRVMDQNNQTLSHEEIFKKVCNHSGR